MRFPALVEAVAAYLPFVALLGLVIGSFLNVVIYRLPRDLSVSRPRWSFCPSCGEAIAARDNLPVLGWLLLRGRCRRCGEPISLQYPLVELLTAIVFVATFDALFIGRVRQDVGAAAADALLLAAYLVLFAALLASAVMDLEEYLVDLRVTAAATITGLLLRAAWNAARPETIRDASVAPGAAGAIGLAVGLAAFYWWRSREPSSDQDNPAVADDPNSSTRMAADALVAEGAPPCPPAAIGEGLAPAGDASAPVDAAPAGADDRPAPPGAASASAARPAAAFQPAPILILALLLAALCALALSQWSPFESHGMPAFALRAVATLAILSFVLVLAAMQPREADAEMIELLTHEQPRARRVAIVELAVLMPALLAGGLVYYGIERLAGAATWAGWFTEQVPAYAGLVGGLLRGVQDAAAAAALGWGIRIGFTLLFGKEAFGTGDIHIMAAIAAVGGFWMCLVGFFAAGVLGSLGVLAALFRKSVRALPFGPWLALGALVGLWLGEPLYDRMSTAFEGLWYIWRGESP